MGAGASLGRLPFSGKLSAAVVGPALAVMDLVSVGIRETFASVTLEAAL